MTKKEEKIKVVTTKNACKILDCSEPTFVKKYQGKLTVIDGKGRSKYYKLDEVQALADAANYVVVNPK